MNNKRTYDEQNTEKLKEYAQNCDYSQNDKVKQ